MYNPIHVIFETVTSHAGVASESLRMNGNCLIHLDYLWDGYVLANICHLIGFRRNGAKCLQYLVLMSLNRNAKKPIYKAS